MKKEYMIDEININFLFLLFSFKTLICLFFFFFSSRRRHTRCSRDWSSDVCSSDLGARSHADPAPGAGRRGTPEGVGVVRDRRERARGRWAVRFVLRRGRGNRRGALAR